MKILLAVFQLLATPPSVPAQIDRACFRGYSTDFCQFLAVRNGLVRFLDPTQPSPRDLVMGPYVPLGQGLVPSTEATIRDLRSPHGWHLLVSAFLVHDPPGDTIARLRVRFFDRAGDLRLTHDLLSAPEEDRTGHLFGGNDGIFAITSGEEHAYNDQTEIWSLPERGEPRRLLVIGGGFADFSDGTAGNIPGVQIERRTYDGEHAATKGFVKEFYAWSLERKALTLQR